MPSAKTPFDRFMVSFRRQRTVADPVAAEVWTFKDAKGRKRPCRVAVGKPQRVPDDGNGDWFCPVQVDGWTPHVVPAMGVGPVDALMNALTLVRGFREHVAQMHIRSDRGAAPRRK